MKNFILILVMIIIAANSSFARAAVTPEDYSHLSLSEIKKEIKKLVAVQVYIKIGQNEVKFKVLKEGFDEVPVLRNIKMKELVKIKRDVKAILKKASEVSALEAAYVQKLIRSNDDKTHYGYKAVFSSEENPYIDYYSHDLTLIHRENIDYE